MHVISRKKIREFLALHANIHESALEKWYKEIRKVSFNNFADVRALFPSADCVGALVVFNVAGNNIRIIAKIEYHRHEVYIRHILNHKEYDSGKWKEV